MIKQNGYQIYRRLLIEVTPYITMLLAGVIATVMASSLDAGIAYAIKPILDKGFVARSIQFIQWLPFAIVVVFLLRGASNFTSTYCITRVARSVVMRFRQKIFHHFMHLPVTFFDENSSGKLLSAVIYNVEQVAEASTNALITVAREGFYCIGLLVVMFSLSWRLSLLLLIAVPAVAGVLKYTTRRLRRLSQGVQGAMGDVTHVAQEGIEGFRVIRTFGGVDYEKQKFDRVTKHNFQQELKVAVTNAVGSSGVQVVGSIPVALTLYLATSHWLHISAGSFAAIITSMISLLRPVRRLTRMNGQIQKGIAGASSVFELLDQPVEKDEGVVETSRAKGELQFKQVSFHYRRHQDHILNQIDLSIQAGETVALVGHSGAGKSTLAHLLPRFYEITSGEILLDQVDLRDYQLNNLRQQFAFVSQQVMLFNDTVLANIAYGQAVVPSEAVIWDVLKAAHADDFIRQLPDGLQTIVGDNGVLLSGGQRQRLAIARALLRDAPVLILDEATSALDNESERHIQSALETVMQNRTTLVIAHRLSTIEKADKIVVMKKGQICEVGTHGQLLQKNGYYSRLYQESANGLVAE